MAHQILRHEFVEFIPSSVEGGILYVSLPYATAVHRCCCGCRAEIVTPLTPTDWTLLYDGETVSLDPSVGSWSLPCRSHYFISRGKVEWSGAWSRDRVAAAQTQDRQAKSQYFSQRDSTSPPEKARRSTADSPLPIPPHAPHAGTGASPPAPPPSPALSKTSRCSSPEP